MSTTGSSVFFSYQTGPNIKKNFKKVLSEVEKNSVTSLNLEGIYFDEKEFSQLIKALQHNTTVEKINFAADSVSPDQITQIEDLLKKNKKVDSLNFGKQAVHQTTATYIVNLLKNNFSIRYLHIENTLFHSSIEIYLKRNKIVHTIKTQKAFYECAAIVSKKGQIPDDILVNIIFEFFNPLYRSDLKAYIEANIYTPTFSLINSQSKTTISKLASELMNSSLRLV